MDLEQRINDLENTVKALKTANALHAETLLEILLALKDNRKTERVVFFGEALATKISTDNLRVLPSELVPDGEVWAIDTETGKIGAILKNAGEGKP